MVDTVKLYSKDFKINPGCMITKKVMYGINPDEAPELYKVNGKPVYGDAAFINDEKAGIFFNVKSLNFESAATLQFSAPNITQGANYLQYKPDQFNKLKGVLKEWLFENKIDFNLESCDVSRIDTCYNCFTDNNINAYFDIFRLNSFSRLKKYDYGSTMLFRNSRRQITVYDKFSEYQVLHCEKGIKKSERYNYIKENFPDLNENTLRFEYRTLRKDVRDLKFSDMENEETVIDMYIDALQNFYELVKSRKIEGYQDDNVFDLIETYSEMDGRKFFDKMLKDYALYKILEQCNCNELEQMIDKIDLKQYQKSRIKKTIREGAHIRLSKNDSIGIKAAEIASKIEGEILQWK